MGNIIKTTGALEGASNRAMSGWGQDFRRQRRARPQPGGCHPPHTPVPGPRRQSVSEREGAGPDKRINNTVEEERAGGERGPSQISKEPNPSLRGKGANGV